MAAARSDNKSRTFKGIIHGLAIALLSLLFVFSVGRYVLEPQDNDRCDGMLNKGKWMTEEYKQWQPSGCMSRTYDRKSMKTCLEHSRIIYIGDSIMREQYYAMTQFLRPGRPAEDAIHADQHVYAKEQDITVEMWWDPYLNTTKTVELLQGQSTEKKPSLVIMGSGVWYMRRTGANYLQLWKQAVDRVFDSAFHNSIADALMLSPVEIVEYDLLIPERKETLTYDKISIMNSYLQERISGITHSVTPMVVPFVWNEIVTSSKNQTLDGLHFKEPVTKAQAQLALNYRCNSDAATLHAAPNFPIDTTCCYSYPAPTWYQNTLFLCILVLVPLGIFVSYASTTSNDGSNVTSHFVASVRSIFPSDVQTLTALFIFGLAVIYMYMGDRTQLFGKIFKQYDTFTFTLLILTMLFLGIATLKYHGGDKDAGFLNRDQTDEWKGWMQLVILIYHFVGASRIAGIYNPVRVLVAAYLFQTGYGHFFFFYKKADFGIARILNVMVRLNLLTCVLAYLMKTDYLFYYFSPLVSFWFSVIWITMRILPSYNAKAWFILTKIALAALITGTIIHYPGILELSFSALSWAFSIQWNVTEWRFRLSLDCWIVYVGMLCAYATIKLSEYKVSVNYPRPWFVVKMIACALSLLGIVGFFAFELTQSKTSYTVYHPYMSWIPILSFTLLRNCTHRARNTHSRFFAFIGKISLETFIGQFHMWLAADTRGLLVVLPNAHWVVESRLGWWVNLTVSSAVFIFVCYYLSQATGVITKWICSGAQEQHQKMAAADSSISSSSSSSTTTNCHTPTNFTKVASSDPDAMPLLPTSTQHKQEDRTSSSSSSLNDDDDDNERAPAKLQVECESNEELLSEAWDDESLQRKPRCSWYRSLAQNYWLRAVLCLALMGVVNRFCATD